MKLDIQTVHFTADQKLIEFLEARINGLLKYFDRITDGEAYLKLENSGQIRDKVVEIKIKVPGNTLLGTATDKVFESAIDDACKALKRQLIKYKDKQRATH